MPRIPDRVSSSAVYLYTTREAALAGKRDGATAFCIYVPAEDVALQAFNQAHFYVVTARHVIGHGATFLRVNTRRDRQDLPPVEVFEIPAEAWIPHPDGDDVTVASLMELNEQIHDLRAFPIELAVTQAAIERGDVGRGDEAFFVGRFRSADGGLRNEPSVRFGNVAMLPTPIRSNVSGIMQESFLVEARSLSGYSGSPVFAYRAAILSEKTGEIDVYASSKLWFLGIDWCHLPDWQPVFQSDRITKAEPEAWVRGNTGMAGVVPAWKLVQLLEEPALAEERQRDETERLEELEDVPEGVEDLAADAGDEFGRFENLARKLVHTPKPKPREDGETAQ